MYCVQLFRWAGLQRYAQNVQRTGMLRSLELLWRVQPNQARGTFRHCSIGTDHPEGCWTEKGKILLWRCWNSPQAHLQLLHHDESWICRPRRTSRQLESSLQVCGNVGPWLHSDCKNFPLFLWFCWGCTSLLENHHYVQTLLGATVVPEALWLRNESCQICAHGCRKLEVKIEEWRRVNPNA